MKLRIHKNSLRLRLSRQDVERFRKTGICAEVLRFGTASQLTYTIEASPHYTLMKAEYRDDCIRVQLPLHPVQEWTDSDQVSIAQDATDTGGPALLIEKDFQCLVKARTQTGIRAHFPIQRLKTSVFESLQ